MKKIIVPTDFSKCALDALKVAAAIAHKANAAIHLLHVFEHPQVNYADIQTDSNIKEKILLRAEEELKKLAIMPFMIGIKSSFDIFPDAKIWEALGNRKFTGADLIVIGSHGIRGWRELFIGSNTEKVVRHSEIPVLVIKEGFDNFEVNNMVFASDFFSEADDSYQKIESLTRLFLPKIHLLKIITPGNFEPSHVSFSLMKDFIRRFQLHNFSINTYNDRTVEEGVLNFCKEKGADLVALETHGRTGFSHLLNGSLTEKIVNHVALPVLSLKINLKPLNGTSIKEKEMEELDEKML